MATTEIGKYRLYAIARTDDSYRSSITLYDTSHQVFAALRFTPGTVLDPHVGAGGAYVLYFPMEDYERVVDLLRNESPVYLRWGPGPKYLKTGAEGVGEGEIAP